LGALSILCLLAAMADAPTIEPEQPPSGEARSPSVGLHDERGARLRLLLLEEARLADVPALDRAGTIMVAGFVITAAALASMFANIFLSRPSPCGDLVRLCDAQKFASADIVSGVTAVFGGATTLIGAGLLHQRSAAQVDNEDRLATLREQIAALNADGVQVPNPVQLVEERRKILEAERPRFAIPVAMFIDGSIATLLAGVTLAAWPKYPTLVTAGLCELAVGLVLNALGIWQLHRQNADDKHIDALLSLPPG
jgi:hypothetical protein